MARFEKTLIAAVALAAAAAPPALAERPRVYAINAARAIVKPGQTVENCGIVLRDGLIEAVGPNLKIPEDAYVIDAAGKTVTAGFIDACTDIGQKRQESAPAAGPSAGSGPPASREPPPGPLHPISRIRPERRAVDSLTTDASAFEKHRGMGFTSAVTMPGDGIFRGEAVLINLGDGSPSSNIVRTSAGQVVGLEYGGFGQGYPTSLMGAMAAIRQALLDAQRRATWASRYQANPVGMLRPDHVSAFGPLTEVTSGRTKAIFDLRDAANITRAISLAKEFSLDAILIGSGTEVSQRGTIGRIKQSGYPVILPIAFPEKPKVEDPDEALAVTLRDLERWDLAPENPAKLSDAGVSFALGTCRLSSASEFPANLRKAIARGLKPDDTLAALTTSPARMFGVEKSLGTIEAGKIANLVVFDGAAQGAEGVFGEKVKPIHLFVDGVKHDVEQRKSKGDPTAKVDPRGTWSITFTIGGRTVNRTWTLRGKEGDYSGTAETQAGLVDFLSVKLAGNEMTLVLPGQGGRPSQEVVVVITGDTLEGEGEFSGGMTYSIKGTRTSGPDGAAL